MENIIIFAVLAVILAYAVYSTVRHFKKKGGCCSGGDFKLKKKKLKQVIAQKTFRVEGMHCEKCKSRVEEAVNDINGVAGTVNLKKSELTVSYAEMIDDELIIARITKAGYRIVQ